MTDYKMPKEEHEVSIDNADNGRVKRALAVVAMGTIAVVIFFYLLSFIVADYMANAVDSSDIAIVSEEDARPIKAPETKAPPFKIEAIPGEPKR